MFDVDKLPLMSAGEQDPFLFEHRSDEEHLREWGCLFWRKEGEKEAQGGPYHSL